MTSNTPHLTRQQSGAVLILALIILVLLTLSTTALVRSFDTSLIMAGNIGFKRDLVNQGERAMTKAISAFKTGTLASTSARKNTILTLNYFASRLETDSTSIPKILIKDSTFTGTAGDITDSATGVTIRYVIDRLCHATGDFSQDSCVSAKASSGNSGSASNALSKVGTSVQPVYRISVRVSGPHNVQAFLQSTFTY